MFLTVDASSIAVAPFERRADKQIVRALAQHPVALIGDAVQRMGMLSAAIRPRTSLGPIAGSILPILVREGDNLAIHRALDEAQEGDVLVVNAQGYTDRAVFGGLLGAGCVARGIAGVVIDGALRDVEEFEELGLPVYARAVSPAGPYKHGPGSVGMPVACGNVVCNPGDVIVGDADGLIVLPVDAIAELLPRVEQQAAYEIDLKAGLVNGASR
ncbi:RraA family protein [Agrococcus sp. ARC_14]|uniref:RraA family protein n=1 Tax=Agrococcus sp. ARC_14 TaxID=2919927 RepID=UPI001F06AE26|nr:RraA family protein [Agrococcus sp. ARC_14]MCH1881908.1 RraA family protein [Agrococcus sp. ARC_14]